MQIDSRDGTLGFLATCCAVAMSLAALGGANAQDPAPAASVKMHASASAAATAATPAAPAGDKYYIEFRSRYAMSYGHSFVVFGRGAAPGKKIDPKQIAGLHPASDSQLPTKAEYDKVVGFVRKLQASSPVWHAEIYNCNAFVADIAKFMGLKTPTSMVFPKEFMTGLRELNGAKPRLALGGTAAAVTQAATPSRQQ